MQLLSVDHTHKLFHWIKSLHKRTKTFCHQTTSQHFLWSTLIGHKKRMMALIENTCVGRAFKKKLRETNKCSVCMFNHIFLYLFQGYSCSYCVPPMFFFLIITQAKCYVQCAAFVHKIKCPCCEAHSEFVSKNVLIEYRLMLRYWLQALAANGLLNKRLHEWMGGLFVADRGWKIIYRAALNK